MVTELGDSNLEFAKSLESLAAVAEPASQFELELNPNSVCDGPTAELVAQQGRRVCQGLGLCRADFDEICQELRVDLARRARHFDPSRGPWMAFARHVVQHRACTLFRQRVRTCREHLCTDFLPPTSKSSGSLDDFPQHTATHDVARDVDRQLDLNDAISTLVPPLPKVCRLIQIGHSTAEISRLMSVRRSVVRGWMQRIRRRLEDRNLDQYL